MGMTVMVDQTRSGFIPCAAYCKSANTVFFPQTIQCNVHDERNLGLDELVGRLGGYGRLTAMFELMFHIVYY